MRSSLLNDDEETKQNKGVARNTLPDDNGDLLLMDRRHTLMSIAAATILIMPQMASASASTSDANTIKSLEDITIGEGRWNQLNHSSFGKKKYKKSISIIPASFVTYATRFLIQYDEGVSSWWNGLGKSYSLLSNEEIQRRQGKDFGSFARSVQLAFDEYMLEYSNPSNAVKNSNKFAFSRLLDRFMDQYGTNTEAKRHIGILFTILPPKYQPTTEMKKYFGDGISINSRRDRDRAVADILPNFTEDPIVLLPKEFNFGYVESEDMKNKGTKSLPTNSDAFYYRLVPSINLYEFGNSEESGQTTYATLFGPLSSTPLVRDKPKYSSDIYKLFAISGATSCVLTHSLVIPLDVVKTRSQIDVESKGLIDGAKRIFENEGVGAFLLGSQATIAGYFWYGLSVYPSYAFVKRYLTQVLLTPEIATFQANNISLFAGAVAAVIASIGLTPLEAARIRAVAQPEVYQSLGVTGTLSTIANEDKTLGWKALYAGLPSLMTRQVIFGSIKFLAFERACDAIFTALPAMKDTTATSLVVSLVAGGFAGALSSVVSQPADSVLTYVAQNKNGGKSLGLVEGSLVMVQENGVASLFRGLGSRCVWAGSIIAGQFLLYDVFRTFFQVNSDDMSQSFQLFISTSLPTSLPFLDAPLI